MSEELIQRNLLKAPEKMGAWNFYNIGATTLKSLKGAKIIPDRDYEEYEAKKPDALIVKKPQVIAAIEYKQPKELRTKKQIEAAIAQEIGTARAIGAKIYIVTDGQKTFWINPLTGNEIKLEDGGVIALQFCKDDPECIKLISKALVSINAENDTIFTSAIVDPLPLAQKVWQDLWAVSGATPENCLYTFVEVFIFKYLSDLGVLTGFHSFNHLLNQYKTNSDNDVIEYYASTVRTEIKKRFPRNEKDGTTIINGTIFVSKDDRAVSGYATVFRKILERFRDFGTLENIDYDFKSKLFETFLKESISKKNWGQFFTPLKVVRSVVKMVDIREGMKICDPACGVGKFLLEPIIYELPRFFKVDSGKLIPQISLYGFDKGFDKDEQKTIILAKANMLIYMSGLVREHSDLTNQFAELFNEIFLLQTNSILGTLAKPIIDEYDLILTNPPYVMSGSSNLKDEISKQDELKNYFSVSAMGIEGLFMEWIVRALRPGGKAFVVVPDGIMNRSNDKRLRDFILEECNLDAVISLPLNTFFTTNKKTYIMVLTKKMTATVDGVISKERQATPVFTYLCSEIGETRDIYRFDIEQNDLDVAADLYNVFKAAGERNEHREDKRCKIVNIEEFYNGSHWSVERWWTREEKIELGIEEEVETVSVEDFISMITDTATTLTEFEEPLRELIKKKSELINSRLISLSDENLFEMSIGNRLLKKDFIKTNGTIPAYSANVFKPFTYTEKSNIDDFSVPYVIWGIDGNFESNVIKAGSVFATTDHCGALKIKNPKLNPHYLAYMLEQTKHVYGFDRGLRASLTNMRKIEINVPTDETGDFDIVAQDKIAEQYVCLGELKREIGEKAQKISDVEVAFVMDDVSFRTVHLTDKTLFVLITSGIGSNKTLLNSMDTKDEADIPVYTAGKEPVAYIKEISSKPPIPADIEHPLISFATNGDGSAGRNFVIHNRPFYINVDRMAVDVKDANISLLYILSQLTDMKRKYGFNFNNKANRHNLAKVTVDIPICKNGIFDLGMQQEISEKCLTVAQYKSQILGKLDALVSQRIVY